MTIDRLVGTTTAAHETRPAMPTEEPHHPGRRRLPRVPVWTPWVVAPVVVLVLYAALPAPNDLRSHYQASGVALVSAPALAWLLTRRAPLAHHAAAALTACILPVLTLISLHGTNYFFAGISGDQTFRLEYAARFASDLGSLTDYTYDVPAFYSPGWFWTVGATSVATGEPVWRVYKWVAIASMFLAVLLAFLLWRRSCGTRLSALLVTVTTIGLPSALLPWLGRETLLLAGAYEPYSWLVALPLPALLTWFAMGGDRFSPRRGVVLGVLLGLAAWVYLLYTTVAVVGLLLIASGRGRWRARWPEVAIAGVTSMVLVVPWLGRFLLDWWAAGRPAAVPTTYVSSESFVRLVIPVASPWLALAGLGAVGMLALRGAEHRRLLGTQSAAAAVLLFGAAQVLAGQVGRGVLFHRVVFVLGIALLAGGTLTLAALAPALLRLLDGRFPSVPMRPLAAAVLAVALLVSLLTHADEWMTQGDLRPPAFDVAYPDGTVPPLASAQSRPDLAAQVPVDALADAVRSVARLTGQPQTTPVLTDDVPLLTLTHLFGYQQWWDIYANPLGRYPERRHYLERLSRRSPEEILRALRHDADAPTLFVLRTDGGHPTYTSLGWDPATGQALPWSVTLPAGLFDRPEFVTRRLGSWTVAAVRPERP